MPNLEEIISKNGYVAITGYPFSGKKYKLYRSIEKLRNMSFCIVYHRLSISNENQWKDLKNIQKGVDSYELEAFDKQNFDKIKDKIKGKTVIILFPKILGQEQSKELREVIEEIKKDSKVIIVARDYVYDYVFGSRKKQKLKAPKEIKVVCDKEEANIILNTLGGASLSDELKNRILRYARINHGPYRGYYFPSLIIEGVRKMDEIGDSTTNRIEKFEKELAELGFSASIVTSSRKIIFEQMTKNVIKSIIKFLGKFIPRFLLLIGIGLGSVILNYLNGFMFLLLLIVGAVIIGVVLTLLSNNPGKKSFIGEIIKWYSTWRNLPQEKREYIAYQYDKIFDLPPGESLNIINNVLENRLLYYKVNS